MAKQKTNSSQEVTPYKSTICGSTNGVSVTVGSTQYIGLALGTSAYLMPISCVGTLKNLYVYGGTAPGSGKTYTCTLMKNGAATDLVATVSGTGSNAGSDTTHTVAVAAGDRISIRVTETAGSIAMDVTWGLELDAL